jgi:hypothetical protein
MLKAARAFNFCLCTFRVEGCPRLQLLSLYFCPQTKIPNYGCSCSQGVNCRGRVLQRHSLRVLMIGKLNVSLPDPGFHLAGVEQSHFTAGRRDGGGLDHCRASAGLPWFQRNQVFKSRPAVLSQGLAAEESSGNWRERYCGGVCPCPLKCRNRSFQGTRPSIRCVSCRPEKYLQVA